MIKKNICIKNYQNRINNNFYGYITGLTVDGNIDYYSGQTESDSFVDYIPILITQIIDDIGYYSSVVQEWTIRTYYYDGDYTIYNNNSYRCISGHTSGLVFEDNNWIKTPTGETSGSTVTFTGDTRIDQFRRYGKTDIDDDLYNSNENTGFTKSIYTSDGMIKQLVSQKDNPDGLSYQPLYDYKIWVSGDTGTTINYSDIGDGKSVISYMTSGSTTENTLDVPSAKLDYLIGVIESPKIDIDVFIDRGNNSSFDRHIKLGDLNSLNDLEMYGNGFYKIKED